MRPDEWLFPVDDDRAITAEEAALAQDIDPEVALISDYLIGDLDPVSRAEVERRLAEDLEFRTRVAPIMVAWKRWPKVSEIQIPEAEMAASWQRFLVRAAQEDDETQEDSEPRAQRTADDPHRQRTQHELHRRRTQVGRLQWLVTASLLGLAASLTYIVVNRQLPVVPPPETHIVVAPTVEAQNVFLRYGGQVNLGPASRLSWADAPDGNDIHTLYLDGSASFILPHLASGQYVVITRSAIITVTGTRFTVDMDDTNATHVKVIEGEVLLSPRGKGIFEGLFLGPNERAAVVRGQQPRREP